MVGPCPWEGAYKACAVLHEINSVLYDQSLILSVPIDETISMLILNRAFWPALDAVIYRGERTRSLLNLVTGFTNS